jgi:hypothetical protein
VSLSDDPRLAAEEFLDVLRTQASKRHKQITVRGPGRCGECSFYVKLQGHRDGCSRTAPVEPGEVAREETCPGAALGRCSSFDCKWVTTKPDDVLLFVRYAEALKEAERAEAPERIRLRS